MRPVVYAKRNGRVIGLCVIGCYAGSHGAEGGPLVLAGVVALIVGTVVELCAEAWLEREEPVE